MASSTPIVSLRSGMHIVLLSLISTAIADMPYGYYGFLRIAATIGFIALAYIDWAGKRLLAAFWIALALLFNPLIKTPLPKSTWHMFDGVAVFILAVSLVIGIVRSKRSINQHP